MERGSAVVVELCGLPGSGKTTLATALQDTLAARGIACRIADREISAAVPGAQRATLRVAHATSTSVRRPLRALRSAQRFAAAENGSVRDTAAALAQWLAVADLTRQARHRSGVHVLEEGLVQTAWTLLLRARLSPHELSMGALLDAAPVSSRSDLVLLMDVPAEVAVARLAARGSRHSRTQLLEADQRLAELVRGRELLELLLSETPGAVHRLQLLPGVTPAQAADEAAAAIAAMHGARR